MKQNSVAGKFALLSNITAAHTMLERLKSAPRGMPRIGALYGESGLGKTQAAAYAANPNTFSGVYVSCRAYETAKSLAEMICHAMGLATRGTIVSLIDEIVEELSRSERPLVVDEVDRIVETRSLELIRDIHDQAGCAILLIGEERLPAKMKRHERCDNRVLVWQPAHKCSGSDFDKLAKHYVPHVSISAELKKRVLEESNGVTRRVVINLENIASWCNVRGKNAAGDDYDGDLYNGAAPRGGR